MTYEEIMERMLSRIPDNIDKREGSIVFDAIAPCAIELIQLYEQIDWAMNQSFIDTAEREYLILKGRERGLSPFPAKAAEIEAYITPLEMQLPIGTRFTCNGLNYFISTLAAQPGKYYLTCEDVTTEANSNFGTLVPIDYIDGLQSAELLRVYKFAEAEESTEAFRNRYLTSFSQFAFGGNKADYIQKIGEVPGVGGVKVYPAWNGGGTVKIVFIDSTYGAPSTALVGEIQGKVDPFSAGMGVGIAPIGHSVTVAGATIFNITIYASITYETGYTYVDVKSNIDSKINEYFLNLSKDWQNNANVIVRISELYSLLLSVPRVVDVQNLRVNNSTSNLVIDENSIPRGTYVNASG